MNENTTYIPCAYLSYCDDGLERTMGVVDLDGSTRTSYIFQGLSWLVIFEVGRDGTVLICLTRNTFLDGTGR